MSQVQKIKKLTILKISDWKKILTVDTYMPVGKTRQLLVEFKRRSCCLKNQANWMRIVAYQLKLSQIKVRLLSLHGTQNKNLRFRIKIKYSNSNCNKNNSKSNYKGKNWKSNKKSNKSKCRNSNSKKRNFDSFKSSSSSSSCSNNNNNRKQLNYNPIKINSSPLLKRILPNIQLVNNIRMSQAWAKGGKRNISLLMLKTKIYVVP